MNTMSGNVQVTARGDNEIVVTRAFNAPRALVYEAMTKPALLKRWLGVFGGWSLDECEVDARMGGRYRYVWKGPNGERMGMGGTYREVVPGERLVATEQFDEAWYPGEAVSTTSFTERDGRTTLAMTIVYSSKETRDAVLKTPMAEGMSKGYDALDALLASQQAK
ncbi:MAG: SRPBCC family protein [Gemmatimonadaceae bacterium]